MSTTTTTIETQGTTVENNDSEKKIEGVVGTLLDLGFAWAAYGLKIATSAVEHSSRVLTITAEALDKLGDEFAKKANVKAEAPAAESAK